MKAIQSLIGKVRTLVNGSFVKALVLAAAIFLPLSPMATMNVAADNSLSYTGGADNLNNGSVYDESVAGSHFTGLAQAFQTFASVLLIIGIILAGLMFMQGKTTFAYMTFAGAVVVFGGSYVVGMIATSLNK